MNLDSRALVASLTDRLALSKDAVADWSPTPAILNMDSSFPIRVSSSTMEFGIVLSHAGHLAKDTGLALEVTSRSVEFNAAPAADTDGPITTPWVWYSNASLDAAFNPAIFLLSIVSSKSNSAITARNSAFHPMKSVKSTSRKNALVKLSI